MPANIVPIFLCLLLVILSLGYLFIQLRYRLQSTKGIHSFTDLQTQIQESPYTLLQLFVPL